MSKDILLGEAQTLEGEAETNKAKGAEAVQERNKKGPESAAKATEINYGSQNPIMIAVYRAVECGMKGEVGSETENLLRAADKNYPGCFNHKNDNRPFEIVQRCKASSTESKSILSGLKEAALPLAALAAGTTLAVVGGTKLADKLGKKNEEPEEKDDKDEDEEEEEVVEEAPLAGAGAAAAQECGANAVLENGICAVKSEDDICYASDGSEDKTQVRNTKGVCVALSSLCETGYVYNSVDKVCKKSKCGSGFNESATGDCVADAAIVTGIIAGPIEEAETATTSNAANKVTRGFSGFANKSDDDQIAKNEDTSPKGPTPLRWANPKKEKSLRDTLRK